MTAAQFLSLVKENELRGTTPENGETEGTDTFRHRTARRALLPPGPRSSSRRLHKDMGILHPGTLLLPPAPRISSRRTPMLTLCQVSHSTRTPQKLSTTPVRLPLLTFVFDDHAGSRSEGTKSLAHSQPNSRRPHTQSHPRSAHPYVTPWVPSWDLLEDHVAATTHQNLIVGVQ